MQFAFMADVNAKLVMPVILLHRVILCPVVTNADRMQFVKMTSVSVFHVMMEILQTDKLAVEQFLVVEIVQRMLIVTKPIINVNAKSVSLVIQLDLAELFPAVENVVEMLIVTMEFASAIDVLMGIPSDLVLLCHVVVDVDQMHSVSTGRNVGAKNAIKATLPTK